jgi:hypothetical protein
MTILAMPGENMGNFSLWANTVKDNVVPISYTVKGLETLITQSEFPEVNVTELASEMKNAFEEYCTVNPLCKNPRGDPSWPSNATSNINIQGEIGINNMDALTNKT